MKRIARNTLLLLASLSTSAHAAADAGSQGGSFLLVLFLAFLAMIFWFQLLPALKHFTDLLKGLTSEDREKIEKPLNGSTH